MTAESKTKAPVSHFIDANDPFAKQFGITNDDGLFISRQYVNQYVQCWCRMNKGYNGTATFSRKTAFALFNSDQYLQECVDAKVTTGSAIGQRASLDAQWGDEPRLMREANAKRKTVAPAPVAPAPITPAVDVTSDPEAAAFAANALVNEAAIIVSEPAVVEPTSEVLLADAPQHQAKQTRREKLGKQLVDEAARIMQGTDAPVAA